MKQIIFGSVLALLLFGFFVEQAAQETGTNGGLAAGGTNGAIAGNGRVGTSGHMNGKNGANANDHSIGNTTGLAIPGED